MAEYSIGIDVGGTFTDVTVVEMASGRAWLTKVESTPADPSEGFMAGLVRGTALAGVGVEPVDQEGNVLLPLDEGGCRDVARQIRALGVESVAICFLYAFLHPEHERRAAEIVQEKCPGVWVSASSVVLPQFREFERSMATVLNAYVTPHVSRYLRTVSERLAGVGSGASS